MTASRKGSKPPTRFTINVRWLGIRAPSALLDLNVGVTWVAPTTCSHLRASQHNLGVEAEEKKALQYAVRS